MTVTEEKLVDRVRKLLALAESSNENEAAAAAEKAQELMLRYGIELAQVAAVRGRQVGVGHEDWEGGIDPWRRQLAEVVARSLGGSTVWANEPRKWTGTITFWGQRDTVPGMVAMFQYLEGQLIVISALAAAGTSHANAAQSMRWRRSFLLGAVARIGARLEARKMEETVRPEDSTALVVIRDSVQAAIDEHYEDGLRKDRTKAKVDAAAALAGMSAADEVDLGDPRLTREKGRLVA